MTAPKKTKRRAAGDGGISAYQTKAGERYLIKYRAPAVDGIGSRVVLRRGFPTRKAAAAKLREHLAEVARGTHVTASKLTFGPYLTDTWLPSLRLKPSTEASYAKNVRLHVVPHLGTLPLARITGQRLTALYRRLETSGRVDGEGGLSPRTVRYVHTIVHRALRDAVEDGLLAVNPADRAKPPTASQAKSPEMRCWTSVQLPGEPTPQLTTFLGWAESADDLFVAWQLFGMTGLRRGEGLALRWRDLDVAESRISVRRSAVLVKHYGQGETIEIGPPKNGRSRVVDLDARTLAVLRGYRATLAGIDLSLARDDAPVLPNVEGDGGVRHPERFSRTFQARLRRAQADLGADALPTIRLHDLRHTHATGLLQIGTPVHVVSQRLGHATPTITLAVYGHVLPTMQRTAADSYAAAVFGA